MKYGIRDHRGGGRSSARETISRVVAGALAKLALKQLGIHITAYTSQVGPIRLEENYTAYDLDLIETNPVRCPDPAKAKEMEELIFKIKGEGDTIGGVVTCVVKDAPSDWDNPYSASSMQHLEQPCSASMQQKHSSMETVSRD